MAKAKTKYDELYRPRRMSRKKMVDFICGIGGYQSGYHCKYPLEFNVTTAYADLDHDNLWKLYVDGGELNHIKDDVEELSSFRDAFMLECKENDYQLWQIGTEEAWTSYTDSDTPYETWLGTFRLDFEFGLFGRGGKHLCVTSFEGKSFNGMDAGDLREWLEEKDDDEGTGRFVPYSVSTEKVHRLFVLCVQMSIDCTPEAAGREVAYHAAWRMGAMAEQRYTEILEARKNKEELTACATNIRNAFGMIDDDVTELEADLKRLCDAAGITLD